MTTNIKLVFIFTIQFTPNYYNYNYFLISFLSYLLALKSFLVFEKGKGEDKDGEKRGKNKEIERREKKTYGETKRI